MMIKLKIWRLIMITKLGKFPMWISVIEFEISPKPETNYIAKFQVSNHTKRNNIKLGAKYLTDVNVRNLTNVWPFTFQLTNNVSHNTKYDLTSDISNFTQQTLFRSANEIVLGKILRDQIYL